MIIKRKYGPLDRNLLEIKGSFQEFRSGVIHIPPLNKRCSSQFFNTAICA
jgi:hypothetical protein